MKKILALICIIVFVFSFSVSSFALSDIEGLDSDLASKVSYTVEYFDYLYQFYDLTMTYSDGGFTLALPSTAFPIPLDGNIDSLDFTDLVIYARVNDGDYIPLYYYVDPNVTEDPEGDDFSPLIFAPLGYDGVPREGDIIYTWLIVGVIYYYPTVDELQDPDFEAHLYLSSTPNRSKFDYIFSSGLSSFSSPYSIRMPVTSTYDDLYLLLRDDSGDVDDFGLFKGVYNSESNQYDMYLFEDGDFRACSSSQLIGYYSDDPEYFNWLFFDGSFLRDSYKFSLFTDHPLYVSVDIYNDFSDVISLFGTFGFFQLNIWQSIVNFVMTSANAITLVSVLAWVFITGIGMIRRFITGI